MRPSCAAVLAAVLAGPMPAEPPSEPAVRIARTVPMALPETAPVKVAPGRFVPIELAAGKPALIEASDDSAVRLFALSSGGSVIGVRFDEPDGSEPKEYRFPDAKGTIHIALARSKPGPVRIRATVNGPGDGPPVVAGAVTVEIFGGITPPPKPDPLPITGKAAAFVVVEETSDAAADRALYFTDPRLAGVVRDQKLKYQVIDQHAVDAAGNPPAGLKGYLDRARGKKLPRVFVTDAGGKLLYEGDLPASSAGLAELLNRFKGD